MSDVRISCETVARWFFRLNGCPTIENFVVHPDRRGSQRTDVDILAVRFSERRELLTAGRPMQDHALFQTSGPRIQIFLVEVKGGGTSCTLNAPWLASDQQNMVSVLHAIGVFTDDRVPRVAAVLCEHRAFADDDAAIKLVAIGARRSEEPNVAEPVIQLTWDELLAFVHARMTDYGSVKRDHPQWDWVGQRLYNEAVQRTDRMDFICAWKAAMGVRQRAELGNGLA